MKVIIIGLGNFGAALSIRLTQLGHEVIGVDNDSHRVEEFKDRITSTVCMDAREMHDLKYLPLEDVTFVMVAIGEDFGASVLITAQLKQLGFSRIVARSMSLLHRTVLEAIGVSEIFSPEVEMAESFALKMELKSVNNVFHVSPEYKVIEAPVFKYMISKSLADIGLEANHQLQLIAVKRMERMRSIIGTIKNEVRVYHNLDSGFILLEGDVLVLSGSLVALRELFHLL